MALLVVAVPVLVFAPDTRPRPHTLGLALGIGAALGVPAGLALQFARRSAEAGRRLELRSLNPRLAPLVVTSFNDIGERL